MLTMILYYPWVICSLLNIDARYYSSLVLLYKCMNSNDPQYIKNFFQIRYTKYNLRGRGINLEQSGYNNKFFHNWNKLPAHIKTSSKLVNKLVTWRLLTSAN